MTELLTQSSVGPGGADTRSRLLEAATELFLRDGYEKAGLAQIARRAGLTTGAVYSTFGSKLELLRAVIERLADLQGPDESGGKRRPEDLSLADVCRTTAQTLASSVAETDVRALGIIQFEYMVQTLRDRRLLSEQAAATRELRVANAKQLGEWAEREGHELPLPAEQIVILWGAISPGLQMAQFLQPDAVSATLYENAFRLLLGLPMVSEQPVRRSRSRRGTTQSS